MTIDALQNALSDADKAERVLQREHEQAVVEARRRVNEEFREHLNAASSARFAAQKALDDAKIAERSADQRVGKEMILITYRFSNYGRKRIREETRGIVEVMTPETVLPENLRYGRPINGELIVRLLKKDGTPGIKIGTLHSGWKTLDEQAAIDAAGTKQA